MPAPHGAGMLFTLSVCCFIECYSDVGGMSFRAVVNALLMAALRPVQTFR